MLKRWCASSSAPLVLLAVVSALSLGARGLLLDAPCYGRCTHAFNHYLIQDEVYYVNAARVIAGVRPPIGYYSNAPLGTDPNAEHPQLAKLIIAGSIELFGDGPFAWRIGSLIFGSIAILGMFALVRAAGGSRWVALVAATLMACDNLLLVQGRIAMLDIYVVAATIWGVALYVRGRPLLAGVVLAVAAAFKLVGPLAVVVLALLELWRVVTRSRQGGPDAWRLMPAVRRLAITAFTAAIGFLALLTIMDRVAPPWDYRQGLITGGPFAHLKHMLSVAAGLVSPNGLQGMASYPWDWLIDVQPMTYLRTNSSQHVPGLLPAHPTSKFLGMISPPILLVGMLGLAFAAYRLYRPALDERGGDGKGGSELPALAVAWFLGTWAPFAVGSLLHHRITYLYYMVIVMPGIYMAAAYLLSRAWRLKRRPVSALIVAWGGLVVASAVLMYPFVPAF